MKKVHLIMPMGGAGSRFFKNGFVIPKPLIKLNGKPFLYWATHSIIDYIEVEDIIFVVLQEHIDNFKIDAEIKKYFPNAKIEVIPEILNGALLTCMYGTKNINDDNPIIFNDCDHAFICNEFAEFCKKAEFENIDGGLLSFMSNEPKYSYLQIDETGNIVNTVEKKVVSDYAICGAYYFKNKEIFETCSKEYLTKCQYSEFFVSGVYNIMAKKKLKIKSFPCNLHIPFGTPDEYFVAEGHKYFRSK